MAGLTSVVMWPFSQPLVSADPPTAQRPTAGNDLIRRVSPSTVYCDRGDTWIGRFCDKEDPYEKKWLDFCWHSNGRSLPDGVEDNWDSFTSYQVWDQRGVYDNIDSSHFGGEQTITLSRIPSTNGDHRMRFSSCSRIVGGSYCQHT